MFWYCAFCGRYHSKLKKRYQFPYSNKGMRRIDHKDNVCSRGLLFIDLLRKREPDEVVNELRSIKTEVQALRENLKPVPVYIDGTKITLVQTHD